MPSKVEILKEYANCLKSPIYTIEKYLETFDKTQNKYVPFKLFPDQVTLVKNLDRANENICMKYRQAGVSTTTAAWSSTKLVFAPKESPEKILILANKLDTAVELATKVKNFLRQYPSWMGVAFDNNKNAARHYRLTNGSEVKAVATSVDALRGYTPTVLIFDEAAYIEGGEELWAASMASISTGGKIILISTPNGFDSVYYPVYDQAERRMNNFTITRLVWYLDPRYAKDLKWVKTDNIVHYFLNTEEYNVNEEIVETNPEKYNELISKGYKPCSPWLEGMAKKFKYDGRLLSQEIFCSFIGSGDNVISEDIVKKMEETTVCPPIEKQVGGGLWLWKQPVVGNKYILAADISRGDSEDYTTFSIIDFDNREQVVEYMGKIPPDIAADIIFKWATLYNAFVVVDITGGMGVATSRKLQELGYYNLYFDGIKGKDRLTFNPKNTDKIPGINFNNKRILIIQAFEEELRNGFTIRSQRLINELRTFVYINGRPDHMKGQHDDCIMGTAMALYVARTSFASLEKVDKQTKAMLDSWVNTSENTPTNNTQNTENTRNSNNYNYTDDSIEYNKNKVPQHIKDNMWLFGGGRKNG